MSRLLFAALLAAAVSSPAAFAQPAAPTDQDPFDLARALRDSDQPDLALEYLDDLAKTAPMSVQLTLPIERAKARIKLAATETDEVKRDALVNAAKAELDGFLKLNPTDARAAEAAMSLANVASLQGKTLLSRAARIPDVAGQRAAAALARPLFEDAAAKFQKAADALEQSLGEAGTPAPKRDRTRELYQTILDQGINRYYLGESYLHAEGKDVDARYGAYKSAQSLFAKLGERDATHQLCWIARAWAGECHYPMSETPKAEAAFAKIRIEAAKNPNGPGLAGVRQANFFDIRDKWIQAGATKTAPAYLKVRQMCEKWLADYRNFRVTNETYAITYYAATTKLDEATLGVKVDPKTKAVTMAPNVIPLLKEADKDFRRLAETENEYTARAAKKRPQVIRLLVGDAAKKPEQILTFEECHLTSLVELDKYQRMGDEKATPEQKAAQLARVIALLEREKQLPVPKESLRDSLNSQVMLVYTYRIADQPYRAAVLGEFLARAGKGPTAARAGLNAMLAYLESVGKSDPTDTASRQADTARAMAVALHLDAAIPDDASTDEARNQGARLLWQSSRAIEAFNLLNRITPRYPNLARARLLEGGIAYELLRPRGAFTDRNPAPKFALPLDSQKLALFKLATADLAAVPVANPASTPVAAADYCRVQFQLAQLYLASGPTGYSAAEKIAGDVTALIPTLATLPPDDREILAMEAETIRINAVYGQAMPLHKEKKFRESAERYGPVLAAIEKAGPAVKAGQSEAVAPVAKSLDALRLGKIVVPALNSRVGEGQLDEAGKLLDMLGKLGGNQDQTVSAVFQVVVASKPQIEQLKKEGKVEEAAKVAANLAALAARISGADAKLSSAQLLDLGKIFKELGDFDKGIALLQRVPAPANAAFLKADPPQPPASEAEDAPPLKKVKDDASAAWTADKAATAFYRVAQLELLRTYRLANQLPKAEELLDTVLGKDKDRKTGWGSGVPDFRKEAFHLLEAKAAASANTPDALKLWSEANKGWEGMAGEYLRALIKPLPADAKEEEIAKARQTKEFVRPIYFDLVSESIRCLARAQLQVFAAKKPELDKGMAGLAKKIVDIEKKNPDLNEAVKAKFLKLFDEVAPLKAAYQSAGGEWLKPQ